MSSPAARRYARALYMIGIEESQLDVVNRELRGVASAIRSSGELSMFLASPVVPQEARHAVMAEVLQRLGVGPTVRKASLLLTDRRRGALLPDIADALQQLTDERAGKVNAEVTSAAPLTEAQYTKLAATLEKLTGRAVVLTRKVDASLIGGVVTRIGDKVYDGSVRARLQELRQLATQPS